MVESLLADPVVERLASVGRLVRLRRRFGDERLDATLTAMNVPHCVLRDGEDIGAALTATVNKPAWG